VKPAPRENGFTLVELIVATTVTVLVAGSTVAILRSAVSARQQADRQMALQQEARAAVLTIATALANAYRLGGDQLVLEGTDGWLGEMPADRIRFFTISREDVRPEKPESDVKECEFYLLEPTDEQTGEPPPRSLVGALGDTSLLVLVRRTDPTWNELPDEGGVVEKVAGNVLGLELAYHDGTRWRDDWPEKNKQSWPMAIRIELAVLARSRPMKVWITSRLVNFPHRPAPSGRKG
jgi:type II secretory pathway pseudopilin PulG